MEIISLGLCSWNGTPFWTFVAIMVAVCPLLCIDFICFYFCLVFLLLYFICTCVRNKLIYTAFTSLLLYRHSRMSWDGRWKQFLSFVDRWMGGGLDRGCIGWMGMGWCCGSWMEEAEGGDWWLDRCGWMGVTSGTGSPGQNPESFKTAVV